MTHEEFSLGMDRLTETYGARNYPKERVKGIWRSVEVLPAYAWNDIIDTLICERNTPPMRNQILEAARPYLDDVQRGEFDKMMQELRTWEACRWCKYTGLLRAKRIDPDIGETEAVFRCTYCRAAGLRQLSRGILQWNLQANWTPLYAEGGSPDPWDIPNPNKAELPRERDPHEAEPVAQPGRVQALVAGALAGKKIDVLQTDHEVDFEQIEIDL